ncbi:olfactory receptor 2W1-like [Leopardus geoffroyi]|uniref:olfactory receptor 2W1-like n=1 Tax=Leopardus geoffroyi TaxID=46844 RepID=UPI001E26398C|nr:olfactory receptor 2W1-like [Leopardus geoffroyi]
MDTNNGSSITDFILLGFSDWPQLEHIISGIVFIFYIVTLVGNTTIILVSNLDSQLHTPMYFFLSNLSFLDLCYATSIIPQMLVNLWGPTKSITYGGCVLQFFFALDLGATECLLLAVMAYDRYAAVCQPLYYTIIMHPQLCQKMVLTAWLGGLGSAFILCSLTLKLPRCGHREVDNFFCEMPALLKMACVYSKVMEAIVFALGVILLLVPLSLILISYAVITQAVMRIKSVARWRKVLNTCGSHLTVVTLFYGTIIYMYMKPQNSTSQDEGKFLTFFYTIVTPTLNPLIYTLRNKDVKSAVKRILRKYNRFSWQNPCFCNAIELHLLMDGGAIELPSLGTSIGTKTQSEGSKPWHPLCFVIYHKLGTASAAPSHDSLLGQAGTDSTANPPPGYLHGSQPGV